jgi:hypothetical protein
VLCVFGNPNAQCLYILASSGKKALLFEMMVGRGVPCPETREK